VPIDDDLSLVLRGRPLAAADQRIVEAFAAQAAIALRQERLAEQAAAAAPLAEADRLRTALLRAVSHDLRTPLSSAKAAIAGLRSTEVTFSDEDRAELLATADESLDQLIRLVENLLDMSRLQAGAVGIHAQATSVTEMVPRALDAIEANRDRDVAVHLSEELPEVYADPALLERILVNVLSNAVRYSPSDRPPAVTASEHGGIVEIRIIDHGPGIPETDWEQVFVPFQRLGDRDNTTGIGLGLALSRGLTEAMGGTLTPETTPGGGLTMILSLPAADKLAVAPGDLTDADVLDRVEHWRPSTDAAAADRNPEGSDLPVNEEVLGKSMRESPSSRRRQSARQGPEGPQRHSHGQEASG
jgi:two-component system sensor histidine kinase KdpD